MCLHVALAAAGMAELERRREAAEAEAEAGRGDIVNGGGSQQEIMAASARVSFSFFKDDQKYMYTGI